MSDRGRTAFLALILAQAAHSVEEWVFRLYDIFAPARFVSGLLTNDLAVGFAIANMTLVLFGLWCYLVVVRRDRPGARALAWFWVVLEGANGIGHLGLALTRGGYFPGVATAPFLLASALWLALELAPPSQRAHREVH